MQGGDGDNVTFNDGVCRFLGIQRVKCAPHGLALIVKAALAKFANYRALTLKLSSLINAGGTKKRVVSLRKAGLQPAKLAAYADRFTSVLAVGAYTQLMLPLISDWVKSSLSVAPARKKGGKAVAKVAAAPPASAAAADDDESSSSSGSSSSSSDSDSSSSSSGSDTDSSSSSSSSGGGFEESGDLIEDSITVVKKAFADPFALLELDLVNVSLFIFQLEIRVLHEVEVVRSSIAWVLLSSAFYCAVVLMAVYYYFILTISFVNSWIYAANIRWAGGACSDA